MRLPTLVIPRLGLAAFRRRLYFRAVFTLLILATLGLAVSVLQDEKERSYQNYQSSFRKTQSVILARLRNPAGQLALINPEHQAVQSGENGALAPLLLPFGALDFDDPFKAQQSLESSGCAVGYQDGSSACAALGSNPFAGGFVYIAGTYLSPPLNGRERGVLELLDVQRLQVALTVSGKTTRWIAPLELNPAPDLTGSDALRLPSVGRWTGFAAPPDGPWPEALVRHSRPVRDFRGWVWQGPECAQTPGAQLGCKGQAFFSIRLPSDALRAAARSGPKVVWPPTDMQSIRVSVQIIGPENSLLFDSDAARTAETSVLSSLNELLLPGEQLRVRHAATGKGSATLPTVLTLQGQSDQSERESPWVRRLVGMLPVDTRVPALRVSDGVATPLGTFEVELTGDVRAVERNLSIVATRLLWLVGAMLGAIVLAWLMIEVGLIRRVTELTRRAAAVSYNVNAPLLENRLADLDVSDLRGTDELGILAGGLSDLLQRVKNDISREHQRAAQERDIWQAAGHEIMSPLQSLMVLHAATDDPSHRYVQRMQQAVKMLYGHASPSEAIAGARVESSPLDIRHFLQEVASNAGFAGIDNVRYTPEAAPEKCKVWVQADAFALEDVVTHILNNAHRHRFENTPISLSLSTTPERVRIAIHNQGLQIDSGLLPHVFDYGVSGQESTHGQRGQGLFVVSSYMNKMGGKADVVNQHDGVVFTLVLPRAG